MFGPSSPIDDLVTFDLYPLSTRLREDRDALALELLRTMFFALNWPGPASNAEELRRILNMGYEFNLWTIHGP